MFKPKKALIALVIGLVTFVTAPAQSFAFGWSVNRNAQVISSTLNVYSKPDVSSPVRFTLYKGMDVPSTEIKMIDGEVWMRFKGGSQDYWVQWMGQGKQNVALRARNKDKVVDSYGILNKPHKYAVKLVKYPDATGRIETYKKRGNRYILKNWYPVSYRKEGSKAHYGDLRTIGGPVVRYMYRTTRSGMNGADSKREKFGVYKVSFPMPHDALPHLLDGKFGPAGYNKIPVINRYSNGQLYPHPHSYMGADILIHTKMWGSRGCINIENDRMGDMYHRDIPSELNTEIIPLIVYDEEMRAPIIGKLF